MLEIVIFAAVWIKIRKRLLVVVVVVSSIDSAKYKKNDKHLRFAAIPAKFYENRGENDGFKRKISILTIFYKNYYKIAKINGAKDCKFEFGAVQRNANLLDVENLCKMRLFSLS